MNKEEPYRDQAERLRKRVQKIEEEQSETVMEEGLPPRSRVHQQKTKKTKIRLKYPIIRLLALFFILLPVVIYSMSILNENQLETTTNSGNQEEDSTVEPVQVEEEETEDKQQMEEEVQRDESEIKKEDANGDEDTEEIQESIVEEKEEPSQDTPPPVSEKDQPKKDEFLYHKVQPNETLYRISKKYYGSPSGIDKIRKANGIKDNEILVGQTLKIPVQ